MYFGPCAFFVTVGIILIVGPRDPTRTLPLDLIGTVLIVAGATALLVNVVRHLRLRRSRSRLKRSAKTVTTFSTAIRRRRRPI